MAEELTWMWLQDRQDDSMYLAKQGVCYAEVYRAPDGTSKTYWAGSAGFTTSGGEELRVCVEARCATADEAKVAAGKLLRELVAQVQSDFIKLSTGVE